MKSSRGILQIKEQVSVLKQIVLALLIDTDAIWDFQTMIEFVFFQSPNKIDLFLTYGII